MTSRNTKPALPTHWSPEQALGIFEFLQAMREQLWEMYGSDAQQAWCDQLLPGEPPQPADPNDPF